VSILAEPAADPADAPSAPPRSAGRPLITAGVMAAVWCAGIGVATLSTITIIGWIAAPRVAFATTLPGVIRTAVTFWLISHHASFSTGQGSVGLLPLGLIVLPGALLFRSGGWIARTGRLRGRYRIGVAHAALALAVPYSLIALTLALVAGTAGARPSAWQALVLSFLLAVIAGGLGAARSLVASTTDGSPWRTMLALLPPRARSLMAGTLAALAVLMTSGLILFAISLAFHLSQARAIYDVLSPGVIGGVLLFLVELVYLPNLVVWAVSFAVGPGFAVGAGTSVSASGVYLGMVPAFPPLAALPSSGHAPAGSVYTLAAPFLAGLVAGVVMARVAVGAGPRVLRGRPVTGSVEAAPLWGLLCGVATAVVMAALAVLSGGPLGGGRLTVMGPSAWQVGLLTAVEVGVATALATWLATWWLTRRATRTHEEFEDPAEDEAEPFEDDPVDEVEFVEAEPLLNTADIAPELPDGVVPIEFGARRRRSADDGQSPPP
jgi:hypothetical protein